eukprot:TRINITY_DN17760_c0_g1_i1.p1 TRINITY_DN17760_c0_g1~~TRINITY_DN17760_c0_g1_i1.p1  ORF type:complete len:157 (+),score=42.37 TRINITY_DN17760_c0_g1_i1:70-471(+)
MARFTALVIVAAACCLALKCTLSFVPAPAVRSEAALATAAGAAALTAIPGAANAFVYDGKEYFDVTFGISPLYWGICMFSILYFGATIKNAAAKYNKPVGSKIKGAKPQTPVLQGKFLGKEIENKEVSYKATG